MIRYIAAALLAIEVAIHVKLAPAHLHEIPYIGVGFVLAAALLTLAIVGVLRDLRAGWLLGAALCAGMAISFVLSRTTGLPGFHEAWTSDGGLGLIALGPEAAFLACVRLHAHAATTRSWWKVAAVAAAAGLIAGSAIGVAAAGPATDSTDVPIVALTAQHKVLSSTTIGAGKTASAVVLGGSTTVPSNATVVQLAVTAKGAKDGTLAFYPAGNPGGGNGANLSWTAGTSASGTITARAGQGGELTFANTSSGSVVVTAALTGYSQQVTAGDINGSGGTVGQVLTNSGSGSQWQTEGQAVSQKFCCDVTVGTSGAFNLVEYLTLPRLNATYVVTAAITGYAYGSSFECELLSPTHNLIADMGVPSLTTVWVPLQGVVHTLDGGPVSLFCKSGSPYAYVHSASLIAVQVNAATGDVTPF